MPMTDASPAARLTAAHFSLAAIGLMWTLPFLQPYHHLPLTSFYSQWLAIALGIAALSWMARGAFWRAPALPVSVLPLLGFAAFLVLQHALGKVAYGGQVLGAGLYIVWAALLVMLASGLRRAIGLDGIVTVLAWFLVVGGLVGAVLALLQHYQISDLPQSLIFPKRWVNVSGNLAQSNHFANYSTLALISLAYLHAIRRLHWAALAAGAVPLLFVIGLSGSRSALVFLAFVLGLALLYAQRRGAEGRRLAVSIVAFTGVFAAAQWFATLAWVEPPGGAETVAQRLVGGEGSSGAATVTFRLQIAAEAWEMFLQAPLLGVGWGQFPWHDFHYRASQGLSITSWPFNHAHNIVLQLLAETGLVGVLLIGAAAVLWIRRLMAAKLDPPHWWLVALLGVIAIHSLLEHPLWFSYFLGIAAVAIGLVETGDFGPRPGRAPALLLGTLLAVGAVYAVSVLGNYRDFERLFARGAPLPDTAEFATTMGRALRDPVLRPYAELAVASTLGLDRERVTEKRALSERVLRFAPISGIAYRHAMLLALEGDVPAAERQLARAERVYPDDLEAMVKLMGEVAARHPAEMAPLIRLAAAKRADRRSAAERR